MFFQHVSRLAAAVASAVALTGAASGQDADDLIIRGWLEHARLMPVNLLLDAKLDPGARTSSLDAEILRGPDEFVDEEVLEDDEEEILEIDDAGEDAVDEPQVRERTSRRPRETVVFRVTNENGRSRTLEREVVRYVEIKTRGGGTVERPVVILGFCVAGVWMHGEVNLADRTGFNYPFLVGRNMLADAGVLVDSRETYTRRSRCEPPGEDAEDED